MFVSLISIVAVIVMVEVCTVYTVHDSFSNSFGKMSNKPNLTEKKKVSRQSQRNSLIHFNNFEVFRFSDQKRWRNEQKYPVVFMTALYVLNPNFVEVNFAFHPTGIDKIDYQSSPGAHSVD